MLDFRHIRLRAIAAGLATDIGCSLLVWMASYSLIGAIGEMKHIAPESFVPILKAPVFRFLFLVNGLMFTAAGALVTAMLSRPYCVLNGLLFGILTTLASLWFIGGTVDFYTMLGLAIPAPMAVLVGLLVRRGG